MASEQAERLAAVLAEGVDGLAAFVEAGFTEQAAHCFRDDPRVYLRKAGVAVDDLPVAQPEPEVVPEVVVEVAPEPVPEMVVEVEPEALAEVDVVTTVADVPVYEWTPPATERPEVSDSEKPVRRGRPPRVR